MAILTANKSVVDMDNDEFEKLIKPVAIKARHTALENGAWFSYKNDLCTDAGMFIHEYEDGHKELVKLNGQVGEYEVLKVF